MNFRKLQYPFLFGLPGLKQAAGLIGLFAGDPRPQQWSEDLLLVGHFLSIDPPILCCQPRPQPFGLAHYLAAKHPDQPFVFLLPITMSLERKVNALALAAQHRRFRKAHRNTRLIMLANSRVEEEILLKFGVDTQYAPQNIFVDEAMYYPIPGRERRFDAIYNAQLAPFKRHELARLLPSCAYVTKLFTTWSSELKREQLRKFITQLPSGHLIVNDLAEDDFVQLAHSQVNEAMASAHVGLCLSSLEGAMYASIEYLLAGLPVVSTRSRGGRDVFFHPETTLIVDDNPRAVREGVAAMKARGLPPDFVRTTTLRLVTAERERFNTFIDNLRGRQINRSDPRWSFQYAHKLGGFGSLSKFEAVVRHAKVAASRSDEAGTIGRIDTWQDGELRGWALKSRKLDKRVHVRISVDDRIVAEGIADRHRPDLEAAGYGDGCYGFAISLPKDSIDGERHAVVGLDPETDTEFQYISRYICFSGEDRQNQKFIEGLFDRGFYEGQVGPIHYPLDHYREIGWHKGFDPHQEFSTKRYLAENGPLRTDPLTHFAETALQTEVEPCCPTVRPSACEIGLSPASRAGLDQAADLQA